MLTQTINGSNESKVNKAIAMTRLKTRELMMSNPMLSKAEAERKAFFEVCKSMNGVFQIKVG